MKTHRTVGVDDKLATAVLMFLGETGVLGNGGQAYRDGQGSDRITAKAQQPLSNHVLSEPASNGLAVNEVPA